MMKNSVIDNPPRENRVDVVPGGIGDHERLHSSSGTPRTRPTKSYRPHARKAAGRPFFNHRLVGRGCAPDPELNGKIIGAEIAGRIAEADLAVGAVEIKCLPRFAMGEGDIRWCSVVGAGRIVGIAIPFPPT